MTQSTRKYHTLVGHTNPDLDVLLMIMLVNTFRFVRETLGVVDQPKLKLIPAGPLRAQDWKGFDLATDDLDAAGYLFLDCGDGRSPFDTHGREAELGGDVASVDLLAQAVSLYAKKPWIEPLVRVVSKNDTKAAPVVKGERPDARWPHSQAHLRNVILGWCLLHEDSPETFTWQSVANGASWAFTVIADRLRAAWKQSGQVTADARDLFWIDGFVQRSARSPLDRVFRTSVHVALNRYEQEWELAECDARDAHGSWTTPISNDPRDRDCRVAFITSDSWRASQVSKDDGVKVIVQFSKIRPGHFTVASLGPDLGDITARLRRADLEKRGVNYSEMTGFGRRGHLPPINGVVSPIFRAGFGTVVGNMFRSRLEDEPVLLTRDEIATIVRAALRDARRRSGR